MDEKAIKAVFVPEAHVFSGGRRPSLIKTTPPQISSALSTLYPVIITLNRFLALITWTGEDPYLNFVVAALYALCVLYWEVVNHFLFPIIYCTAVCSTVWFVRTTFIDYSLSEFPPSLEEILDATGNMSARFEFLCSPFRQIDRHQRTHLFVSSILSTPLHYIIIEKVFGLRAYVLTLGVFILTYYSSWSIAVRMLLWRSAVVRRITMVLTGLEFSMVDKGIDTTLLSYKVKSSNEFGAKVVEFEVFENQRRWFGVGWSNSLLPVERQHYCNEYLQECCRELKNFQFPELPESDRSKGCRWKWMEEHWKLDLDFCKGRDSNGWVYYDNYWNNPAYDDSVSKFTRTRRLTRRALLIVSP